MTRSQVYTIQEDYDIEVPDSEDKKESWFIIQIGDQYIEFVYTTDHSYLLMFFGQNLTTWRKMISHRHRQPLDPTHRTNLTVYPYTQISVDVPEDFTINQVRDDPMRFAALAVLECN